MSDSKGLKEQMAELVAQELLVKAANVLGASNELAQCHIIMALHVVIPEAPMPPGMLEMLNKHGFKPDVKVVSEADMLRDLATSDCNCPKCQELRAKYNIAPPVPGSTQVH